VNSLLENMKEWAGQSIGKQIEAIFGLIYFLDGHHLDSPQRLQIKFSGSNDGCHFSCGKDGSTLVLERGLIINRDLGEYGKEMVMNISGTEPYSNYIMLAPSNFHSILSQDDNAIIGVKLSFNNNPDLFLINAGDELLFTNLNPFDSYDYNVSFIDLLK
jgi:hypothetical protein